MADTFDLHHVVQTNALLVSCRPTAVLCQPCPLCCADMLRAFAEVADQPRVLKKHASATSRLSSIGGDVELVKHKGIIFVDMREDEKCVLLCVVCTCF